METPKPLPTPERVLQVAELIKAVQAADEIAQAAEDVVTVAKKEADEKRSVAQAKRDEAEAALASLLGRTVARVVEGTERPEGQLVRKVVHVLMIQSLDFIRDCEPETTGSKVRIRKAAQLVDTEIVPKDAWMVWTQGFSKENPTETKTWVSNEESLGTNLAAYCKDEKKFPQFKGMEVLQEAMGWGTMNDIENACKLVLRKLEEKGIDKRTRVHFHFVTDPTHMKRVKMVWKWLAPREWQVSFHPTEEEVLSKFQIRFMERAKRTGYRLMLLRRKRIRI